MYSDVGVSGNGPPVAEQETYGEALKVLKGQEPRVKARVSLSSNAVVAASASDAKKARGWITAVGE